MFRTIDKFSNWDQIKNVLQGLAEQKFNSSQVLKHLYSFQYFSSVEQGQWGKESETKFLALIAQYGADLPKIYKKIAKFVLDHPNHHIPLFLQNEQKQHTFTKQTIIYLYCSMLLGLIPRQQFHSSPSKRQNFNYVLDFSFIFDNQEHKTKNVIEFIKKQIDNKEAYNEKMTIYRHIEKRNIQQIIKQNENKPMIPFKMQSNEASIQQFYGELKVDFANKYIGGGALMSGCVQQQLMFANHPELFTSQLLCQVMRPNQCLFLSGYKKYFKNKGYGWTAQYDGFQNHQYKYDQNKQALQYITAIDAIPYGRYDPFIQFSKNQVNREILKAFCGFSFPKASIRKVITGNWGCGAFGGNLRLKFLIQWLACSAVGRQMIYCPYGSRQDIYDQELVKKLQDKNVGENYRIIHLACENIIKRNKQYDIYKFINEIL